MEDKEFKEMVLRCLPDVEPAVMDFYMKHPDELEKCLLNILSSKSFRQNRKRVWSNYYFERFGIKTNFASIRLPQITKMASNFLFMPEQINREIVFEKLRNSYNNQETNFPSPVFTSKLRPADFEKSFFGISGRRCEWSYAILCAPFSTRAQALEMSPLQSKKSFLNGLFDRMNHLEWLIASDFFFWSTGGFMDNKYFDEVFFPGDYTDEGVCYGFCEDGKYLSLSVAKLGAEVARDQNRFRFIKT